MAYREGETDKDRVLDELETETNEMLHRPIDLFVPFLNLFVCMYLFYSTFFLGQDVIVGGRITYRYNHSVCYKGYKISEEDDWCIEIDKNGT